MRRLDLSIHLARLTLSLLALAVVGPLHPLLAAVLSLSVYVSAFAFNHDVAHGALALPRRVNEGLLALTALPMLVSGHSMRLMHLRHHSRPLAHDDLEGQGALRSLLGALAIGPANALALRVESWRVGNTSQRRWMQCETVASLLVVAFAAVGGSLAFKVWVVVCLTMQLTASAWASHLPHHPPALLHRIALALVWTRSATMLSFVFHEAHHAAPKVPCRNLGDVE